jgi:hypothetical protein
MCVHGPPPSRRRARRARPTAHTAPLVGRPRRPRTRHHRPCPRPSRRQPSQSRQRWYRDARVPPDQQPAPFRPETAAKVPPADGPGARGRLDLHDGTTGIPIDSGSKTGLTDALRSRLGHLPSGFTSQNRAHVEAHAAAYLRLHPHVTDATLYVNRIPCPGPRGCRDNLDGMLPANTTLTIYAPKGWAAIYHGTPEP